MPDDYHDRERYIALFKELATSIPDYQHEDVLRLVYLIPILAPESFSNSVIFVMD